MKEHVCAEDDCSASIHFAGPECSTVELLQSNYTKSSHLGAGIK
jgi:hypothetical protein